MIDCKIKIKLDDFMLDAKFTIPDKGITVVFGDSGSGKTTLLRVIAGLEKSDDGYLKVGDSVWQKGDNFVPTHKRQIGYVFQDAALFDHLDVKGNLGYVIRRTDGLNKDFIESIYTLLEIKSLLNRSTVQLSGGEKQRVAIARALSANPKLLLADEPTSALDSVTGREIVSLLRKLAKEQNCSVLMVTHDPRISDMADRILNMEDGKIFNALSELR